jgi:hypothetical protein
MDTEVYMWPSTPPTHLCSLAPQVFTIAHPRTTMPLSFDVSVGNHIACILIQCAVCANAYVALFRDGIEGRVQAIVLVIIALQA